MQSSAMDTIKNLLGDNAEDKIKAALSNLSAQKENSAEEAAADNMEPALPATAPAFDNMTLDSLMQIKGIVDNITTSSNDSRSNLLMSLRPYMRTSRQSSIDTAIRLLNISKLSGIFKLR